MKTLNYIALLGLTVGSANAASIIQTIVGGGDRAWNAPNSVTYSALTDTSVASYTGLSGSITEGGETVNFTYNLTVTMVSTDGGWTSPMPEILDNPLTPEDEGVAAVLGIYQYGNGALSDYAVWNGGARLDDTDTFTFVISAVSDTSTNFDVNFDGFTSLTSSHRELDETSEGWSVNGGTANTTDNTITFGSPVANDMDLTPVEYNGITLRNVDYQFSTTPVPEPSSTALLGLGGLALILRRRK